MKTSVLFILLAGLSLPLAAQDPADTLSKKTRYDVQMNLSGSRIAGNFNQLQLAGSLTFNVHGKHWDIHNMTNYRYTNIGGALAEDNWFHNVSVAYFPGTKKLYPSAFYTFDNSLLYRIRQRHIYGAGIGTIQEGLKNTYVRLDLGFGYENTMYTGSNFVNSDVVSSQRDKALILGRLIHKHEFLDKKITLNNRIIYRVSLREADDHFLMISPQLAYKITNNLSATASFEYRLENVYLEGLNRINTVTVFGLTYKVKG
ncbi:MAG TPA: hypothetical protein DCE41_23890 [Cytophagales bacterium]|nr:hypothetical protein [Cytophagales bacterium]HAA21997.1 hypothetical protein [Cytophagales bacterium]HAP62041.1 hypothetical protein [Cytophagales bacterium]